MDNPPVILSALLRNAKAAADALEGMLLFFHIAAWQPEQPDVSGEEQREISAIGHQLP